MTGRSPRKHLSILTAALLAVAVYPAIPVLAQNKAASGTTMADKSQAVLNQLGSRGAKITMTNRAQVMRRAGGLASRMGGGVPAWSSGCFSPPRSQRAA